MALLLCHGILYILNDKLFKAQIKAKAALSIAALLPAILTNTALARLRNKDTEWRENKTGSLRTLPGASEFLTEAVKVAN